MGERIMKGYKAFDKNLKCRGMQFEVGKIYNQSGELKICENGFHFCANILDVYNYYEKSTDTRICEVEALDIIQTEGDKSCTRKLKIIRELSDKELLNIWINRTNSGNRNSGDWNSGDWNSGHRNSGDWNSGNRNSGDWNSGHGNSGHGNSGHGNSGNRNSGDWNSGHGNSGHGNSGNRNSGDWNSGDGNSGYFNTTIPVYFFNKPSTIKYTKELENKIRSINVKPILTWITSKDMSEEEKNSNPSHKITGGFLRSTGRHDWTKLTDADKEFIKSLPNYDDEVFKVISNGVSLLEPATITVEYNGQKFELDLQKAKELGLLK